MKLISLYFTTVFCFQFNLQNFQGILEFSDIRPINLSLRQYLKDGCIDERQMA